MALIEVLNKLSQALTTLLTLSMIYKLIQHNPDMSAVGYTICLADISRGEGPPFHCGYTDNETLGISR